MMYNWGWGNMMGFGAWWGMGWLFMVLFWLAIILAVVALLKWLIGTSSRSEGPRTKDALDILRERYARGEIGRDEFQEKKRDLS
ncbi:MAG: SHOCT domain-containing protein [Gammaproteobacteria bacterium]|nr:SHOCT domain-containing protein [Gammaproteobacteria bacterium]